MRIGLLTTLTTFVDLAIRFCSNLQYKIHVTDETVIRQNVTAGLSAVNVVGIGRVCRIGVGVIATMKSIFSRSSDVYSVLSGVMHF